MINKGAYLQALSDHVKREPLLITPFQRRKAELEYLLNALFNAFKGVYKRCLEVFRGMTRVDVLASILAIILCVIVGANL